MKNLRASSVLFLILCLLFSSCMPRPVSETDPSPIGSESTSNTPPNVETIESPIFSEYTGRSSRFQVFSVAIKHGDELYYVDGIQISCKDLKTGTVESVYEVSGTATGLLLFQEKYLLVDEYFEYGWINVVNLETGEVIEFEDWIGFPREDAAITRLFSVDDSAFAIECAYPGALYYFSTEDRVLSLISSHLTGLAAGNNIYARLDDQKLYMLDINSLSLVKISDKIFPVSLSVYGRQEGIMAYENVIIYVDDNDVLGYDYLKNETKSIMADVITKTTALIFCPAGFIILYEPRSMSGTKEIYRGYDVRTGMLVFSVDDSYLNIFAFATVLDDQFYYNSGGLLKLYSATQG